MGHEFNVAAVKISTHARKKTSRDLIEAWFSDGNSINLASAYRTLCSHLQASINYHRHSYLMPAAALPIFKSVDCDPSVVGTSADLSFDL
ncbi:unnamed protein product [Schistocephalus solidus]|uniref:Uncharacterized protein n=1 Tax=Schistocephalus solidus TaxID=70667 RepID=A0A183T1C2_SCHSO|nr:unnamed protein product [Schistocephalus solidus]